jgi:hypothetical protein
MIGTTTSAKVDEVCDALHHLFSGLPVLGFPYLDSQIPQKRKRHVGSFMVGGRQHQGSIPLKKELSPMVVC